MSGKKREEAERLGIATQMEGGEDLLADLEGLRAKFEMVGSYPDLVAQELGGMPMPSVAVTRLDRPYEWGGAGAINLIGKPEMVYPKREPGQAWTRGKMDTTAYLLVEKVRAIIAGSRERRAKLEEELREKRHFFQCEI